MLWHRMGMIWTEFLAGETLHAGAALKKMIHMQITLKKNNRAQFPV